MKQLYHPVTTLTTSAYLLVTHGSRDKRSQLALEHLTRLTMIQMESSTSEISNNYSGAIRQLKLNTATLEFNSLCLSQQIIQSAQEALTCGYQRLQVLPLFLLPGIHVTEDISKAIAVAQSLMGNKISITQLPCLGTNIDLVQLWHDRLTKIDTDAVILLSHGTSREQGNQIIEATAQELGALTAYCSLSPSLNNRVTMLAQAGCKRIAILPHILFDGAITDVISDQVIRLQEQLPQVKLILEQPLGVTADLAQIIIDSLKRA